jgi:capsule polysaccharide export protein KpsE/RkpR
MELSKLVGEHVEAYIRAGQAKAALDASNAAMQQGATPPAAAARAENDAELRSLQARLSETELRLEAASTKVNENNPGAAELRTTAESLRKRIAARKEAALAAAKVSVLEEATANYNASALMLDTLSRRVDNLKQDLGELSNAMVAYLNLQEEHKGLREHLRVIKQRIETVMAEQASRESIDIHWHLTPDAVP